MHSSVRRAAGSALLLLASVAAAPAGAQDEAPDPVVEAIDVELVNVEVWVTDATGAPVRGLTREDFAVLHDGSPVPITHFAELGDGGAAAGPRAEVDAAGAASETASDEPHLIVLFDEHHLSAGSLKRMSREVRRFLASGRIAPERVLVMRLARGLAIEAPFSSGIADLEEALARLEKSAGGSLGAAAEAKQLVQALQSVWDDLQSLTASRSLRSVVDEVKGATASQGASALPGAAGGAGPVGAMGATSGRACDDYVDRVTPIVVQWAAREQALIGETLRRIGDVASFLSGLPGTKILLYVGDGPGTAPGVSATSFVRGLCPAFQTDLEVDALPQEMDDEFLAVSRRAAANRIVIYPVQGNAFDGSLASPGSQSSTDARGIQSFQRSRSSEVREGLALLAGETGGRALFGSAGLGDELERLAAELGSYYSLAYSPPPSTGVRHHRIDVQLGDPELSARHRRGYSDKSTDQWLTERLESALYLGLVDNPLAVRLGAAGASPAADAAYSLPLHVIVPAAQLSFSEQHGLPLARLQLKVMALNATDRTLAMTDRSFFLPRPGAESGETLDIEVPLELAGGLYVVAVAILDTESGAASFVSATLQVGPEADAS